MDELDHFKSTITVTGSKEDVERFINEFKASAIRIKGKDNLCICQFVDPLPTFVYYSDGYYHKVENRPLTQKERLIYANSKNYMENFWGIVHGCVDGRLIRVNENKVKFKYWTPLTMISPRILILLHNKYPNVTIDFKGKDDIEFIPGNELKPVEYSIPGGSPLADVAELDRVQLEVYQREKERLQNSFFNSFRN
uniref:Growth factor 3 n=1 Tax=Trichomonas vaginalis TaxID=5722 RepID=A0A0U2NYJ3_TRIVA|nr:growth factor 3 [Trichomonas vaginalis]